MARRFCTRAQVSDIQSNHTCFGGKRPRLTFSARYCSLSLLLLLLTLPVQEGTSVLQGRLAAEPFWL